MSFKIPDCYENGEQFVQGLDLDFMDKHLERVERLDAMIERTVKRLMNIKAMKQIHQALEPKQASPSVAKLGSQQKTRQQRSLQ